MIQFEEILHSVTEYSDTEFSTLYNIVRPSEGEILRFQDICQKNELRTTESNELI